MGASGLRSSCASVARNSYLRRSASEKSALIWRSLSAASLRSVISVPVAATNSTAPSALDHGRQGQVDDALGAVRNKSSATLRGKRPPAAACASPAATRRRDVGGARFHQPHSQNKPGR